MRGATQRDSTDKVGEDKGRTSKSTKAKGTHKEREVQRHIISPKVKWDNLLAVCLGE